MERAPNTGTVHIQFYLNFGKPKALTSLKKLCSHSHFSLVKMDNGAHQYCMKQETRVAGPWEFGMKPVQRNNKADWEEVKRNAIAGNLDKIPGDIFVKHYSNLKMIKKDYMQHVVKDDTLDARWYHGASGLGKSRKAWEEFPDAYPKQVNKWWDGY